MATSFEKRREQFGERLQVIRKGAGYETGKDAAVALGWNAPKVSKVERGRQSTSPEDLEDWITTFEIAQPEADSLREALAELADEYVTWKQQVRAGHRARQEAAIELEANARLIRAVDVGVIAGLVQTADYARHTMLAHANLHGGGHDITEAVRARMRRQQILYEPGKSIEILIAESALLHPIAPPDVMAGQIHRLIATIGIPNIRVGILPARRRLPYPLTHGFWIIGNIVKIEQVSGEFTVYDPDEVALHHQVADMLWSAAAEGDEARAILHGYIDSGGTK